ncbi:hypothetical protein BaRGS_00028621 [Batillaria attramentaria]|uniref:Uncharacterized protein n=1 Tax=Batillaria attramentaria TaxID=370345 RepID=A0ABD0JZJ3_9CAEN
MPLSPIRDDELIHRATGSLTPLSAFVIYDRFVLWLMRSLWASAAIAQDVSLCEETLSLCQRMATKERTDDIVMGGEKKDGPPAAVSGRRSMADRS